MRFMVMIKADERTEAGELPSEEVIAAMGRYNEELADAGVLLAGEGLGPSSLGARVKFSDGATTVVDGPFTEAKELIAGFWILQTASREEAVEWVRRCPHPGEGEMEIEIRQIFEADDLGEEFTPELREQEDLLRERLAARERG